MKKIIFKYLVLAFSTALFVILGYGCQDNYLGLEKIATDNIAPSKVIVESVVPQNGALLIKFALEETDGDIAQIKAFYIVHEEIREFTVSRYDRSIMVDGFAEISEKTIHVKAIDNSGNESEEIVVKGTPLIAPLNTLFNSLEVSPTFGGLFANWENETKAALVIHVMRNDTMVIAGQTLFVEDPTKRIYSADSLELSTQQIIGGLPAESIKMGFYVTDRWNNISDTLTVEQTPFEQSELNYAEIDYIPGLFGDPGTSRRSLSYENEAINGNGILKDAPYHSANYTPLRMFNQTHIGTWQPKYKYADGKFCDTIFNTFDLNVDIVLNKIHMTGRQNNKTVAYDQFSVKEFIIYGTTDENVDRATNFPEGWDIVYRGVNPEPDPSWSSAQRIAEFSKGFEHILPIGDATPKIRYVRIGFLSNYGGGFVYTHSHIKMFGSIKAEHY